MEDENYVDGKVLVRLIPRLDPPQKNDGKQKEKGKGAQNKFMSFKPQPKMFNSKLYESSQLDLTKSINGKDAIYYRRQYFINGFLFKDFPYKQL